jgi:RND family efflux transporter MFP subunit
MAARFTRWFCVLLVLVGLAIGTRAVLTSAGQDSPSPEESRSSRTAVQVEVVSPKAGGITRVVSQPGSVEPYESAELLSRVSGFLAEQHVMRNGKPVPVDIGIWVKAGEPLAKIAVPETEKQVKQDEAEATRAEAKVDQAKAAVVAAEADQKAAGAVVLLAQADIKSKASFRLYREKQRDRVRGLANKEILDRKLEDEQEDQYQSALASELAAAENVNAAKQKEAASAAKVKQARADVAFAEADVAVAKAKVERTRVMLEYSTIRSPYTGLITKRTFHVGDFIRSADSGGSQPLFSVERTDVMRVVVQIPERDVPFVDVGDAAEVRVDALPGTAFKATVSRMADSEDPHTRMMRAEFDLPNPDRKLRRGMFGRASITLDGGTPGAVRIPSSAVVGKASDGQASVRLVRDDVVQIAAVRYGSDNGTEIEIVSGLTPADRVIIRANGPVENGTPVSLTRH